MNFRDAPVSELDPVTLYRILALRTDVFVVEQECAYAELDGRDLEPGARQVWVERDGAVLATLRLLPNPDGAARIGRVATAASARGEKLATRMIEYTLQLAGPRDAVLDAQTHLCGWYEGFGFVQVGDEFVEDGIRHVPMRRAVVSTAAVTRPD